MSRAKWDMLLSGVRLLSGPQLAALMEHSINTRRVELGYNPFKRKRKDCICLISPAMAWRRGSELLAKQIMSPETAMTYWENYELHHEFLRIAFDLRSRHIICRNCYDDCRTFLRSAMRAALYMCGKRTEVRKHYEGLHVSARPVEIEETRGVKRNGILVIARALTDIVVIVVYKYRKYDLKHWNKPQSGTIRMIPMRVVGYSGDQMQSITKVKVNIKKDDRMVVAPIVDMTEHFEQADTLLTRMSKIVIWPYGNYESGDRFLLWLL